MIMLRSLRDLGEVTMVASVGETLKKLDETPFDLVITDYRLPDKNGVELIQQLRQRWTPEQLPILMISVSMDRELRQDALLAGANECASKPIDRGSMAEMVCKLIETRYTQKLDPSIIRYTEVRWDYEGKVCIYCPELEIKAEEATLELARTAMEKMVLSQCKNAGQLKSIGYPRVNRLTIHLSPPA
jgi:DNA-binding response OmpR family regulator